MRARRALELCLFAPLCGLIMLAMPAPALAGELATEDLATEDLATEYAACTADQMSDAERQQHCDAAIAFGQLKGRRLAIALDHRGIARARQRNFVGALADFDAAARQFPDLPETYWYRGAVHHVAGDLDRALADADRAVARAPGSSRFRIFRAKIHEERKDFARAIEDLTVTIEQAPRQDMQHVLRAMVYEKAGERDKAIADYKIALEIDSSNGLARKALQRLTGDTELPPGKCSADNVSNEERAAGCSEVIESGKLSRGPLTIAYCNLGYALTEMGQYDRVIESSDAAIKLDPDLACAYLNRGRAWYYKHDLDRAVADYNETIRRDGTFHEAYANRGTVYHDQRDYARAVADYDVAIALESDQPMYHSDRGNTRYLMGEYKNAIADQTRAIEIEPRYLKAHGRRGWAYLATEDYAQAEADFAKALELAPDDAAAEAGLKKAREYRAHPEYAAADREEAKGLNFDHFRSMVEKSLAPRR